ncbi:glycosyltransferase family protein [Aquibacillus kalidii]|uniref:glycosyltransferase family protein n=1 Tax=Aquibacillus kalidii TaxID=2762597 RepID=UPI002E2B5766|nr:glycosyltransferase family protein [Aquibacillus kalidii]
MLLVNIEGELMKIAVIIQARMGSTRLPGKILMEVMGKPLIEYQIERINQTRSIDEVIIATTTKSEDDSIVNLCNKRKINFFRGSEEDVLSRFYDTAVKYNVDVIVRLTSDCPLIDPEVIDRTVYYFLNNSFDYVSNTVNRKYPRGLDVEVLTMNTLTRMHNEAKSKCEREHVTPYVFNNSNDFIIGSIENDIDLSSYRWTVDTEEDFLLVKKIISSLYPKTESFLMKDILDLLELNSEWKEINNYVKQKLL